MTMMSSFLSPYAGDLSRGYGLIGSYDAPPPFLYCLQDFGAPEEVEGQLSKFTVDGILDHNREPGSVGMLMEMTDAEILFNDVADL